MAEAPVSDPATGYSDAVFAIAAKEFDVDPEQLKQLLQIERKCTEDYQKSAAAAEQELERLAGLSRYAYDRVEKKADKDLDLYDFALRNYVNGIRKEWAANPETAARVPGVTSNSKRTPSPAVPPWPDPVTGAELLPALVAAVHRHVSITDDGAVMVALWTLHCHALDAFQFSPRLASVPPNRQAARARCSI